MSERWDRHFLERALFISSMSKDPRTRVGSVIVGSDREPLTDGFNGLPRGIEDTPARLEDKELKLKLIVHAEMNAVLNAARRGCSALKGSTIYVACTDDSGEVWGGPPCIRCAVELIQAGIGKVVTYPTKPVSTWRENFAMSRCLLDEAGIEYQELAR